MSTRELVASWRRTHPVVQGLGIVTVLAVVCLGYWYLWLLYAADLLGGLALALGVVGLLVVALLGWRRRDLRNEGDRA